ncbi:MAG: glycoside hydrolase family 38 C-terminal domain-containing protein [Polyangiaceae bacterium]|nr:glycoside hydrolase family 38 C-terminal domain-containing protein [Polyangiaceae bacterium]
MTNALRTFETRWDRLQANLTRLKGYRKDARWSWSQNDAPFEPVELPAGWDGAGRRVRFATTYTIPEQVAGIRTAGSELKLYSHFTTVTTTIRVDGVQRFREAYWTDFRLPEVIVTPSAVPAATHHVELECEPFEGSAGMVPLDFMLSAVEANIANLETVLEAARVVLALDPKAAELALAELEKPAFEWPELSAACARARELLLPFSASIKQRRVYAMGQCHIDLNFLWPMEDTVLTVVSSYRAICDMLDEFPELVFTHTQAATYEILERHEPALLKRIEAHVASRKWEVLAATWTESDTNLPSGEALIRQFLYGQAYCAKRFGTRAKIAWYPDAFGHSFNLPQILKGCGISNYFFWRCGDQSKPLFTWKGLDGTEVTAFNCDYYLRHVSAPRVGKFSRLLAERFEIQESPYVFGVGNHGGGPSRADIERLRQLQADPLMPTLEFSSAQRYFDTTVAHAGKLPTICRELNFVFDAAYSSHADIKWHNRRCENLLYACEAISALQRGGSPYPRAALQQAWKHKLFNDFHDFLGGTSIREAYAYGLARAEEVEALAQTELEARLLTAQRQHAGPGEQELVAMNPLPWPRTAVVKLSGCKAGFTGVRDDAGQTLPVQYVDIDTLIFVAPFSATAIRNFVLVSSDPAPNAPEASPAPTLDEANLTLSNELLTLTLLPDGTIKTLLDRRTGSPILHTQDSLEVPVCFSDYAEVTRPHLNNHLTVQHEAPVDGSAWFLGRIAGHTALTTPISISFEAGPVRAAAHIVYRYQESTLRQTLSLYRGVPWVEISWDIDWRQVGHRDTGTDILRCSFTPLVEHSRAHFEIPCGAIEREANGREVPTQRWLALSNQERGFAILNDAKYGCSVQGRTMSLTMLRTAYWPDATSDVGRHQFAYGLYPLMGSFETSDVARRGVEFNQPILAVAPKTGTANVNSTTWVSVEVEPQNVVVSAIKCAESSNALVVRIYESHGLPTVGTLRLAPAPKRIRKLNHLEEATPEGTSTLSQKGDITTFSLRPFEICTLELEY